MEGAPSQEKDRQRSLDCMVDEYQKLIEIEKDSLLRMRCTREEIKVILAEMMEAGNNRRVAGLEIAKSINLFNKGNVDEFLMDFPKIVGLFSIAHWNRMRKNAELSAEPESAKWRKISIEADRLRSSIILKNIASIKWKCAQLADKTSLDFDDLVGEGVLGVIRAMEKYDIKKGVRFSSYSMHWVEQKVLIAIRNTSQVKLKSNKWEIIARIKKKRTEMENEKGRPVSNEEIAMAMGVSEHIIDSAYIKTISLSAPIGDGENGICLEDVIASDEDDLTEYEVSEYAKKIQEVLKNLTGMERDVAILRYPLIPEEPLVGKPITTEEAQLQTRNWAHEYLQKAVKASI